MESGCPRVPSLTADGVSILQAGQLPDWSDRRLPVSCAADPDPVSTGTSRGTAGGESVAEVCAEECAEVSVCVCVCVCVCVRAHVCVVCVQQWALNSWINPRVRARGVCVGLIITPSK